MFLRSGLVLVAATLLAACSSSAVTSVVRPYQIEVRQGNALTQEMVSKLSPGMSREQVRFVMGSPMLVSIFHKDRWDYVYQVSGNRKPLERRSITLFFEGDKLARVEGDVIPASGVQESAPTAPRVIDITGPAVPPVTP
jgi:outer membrane protein assembly factor BamE